ncbi:MAG: hypothetical protein NW223_13010 [Hyphomicrobiaceae bacterium]|nr:hypothetical protein [Hyphomicrobiaceae bacterium]
MIAEAKAASAQCWHRAYMRRSGREDDAEEMDFDNGRLRAAHDACMRRMGFVQVPRGG